MPETPRKLTPLQLRFVEAYLVSRNAAAAAREAGYAASSAPMRGYELLMKPHVVAALRARGLEPPRGIHPRTQIRKKRVNPPRTKLTLREQRFVFAYLACGSATEAARRIGVGAKASRLAGFRLLHRPLVAAALEQERAALSERGRIDAEQVLRELGRIAFANIRDVVEWNGGRIVLKPSAALSPDVSAAIATLRAKPREGGLDTSIRLHSKVDALDRLARLLGLYTVRRGRPPRGAPPEPEAPKRSAEELIQFLMGDRAAKKPGE
jgi:phage terminase small subunit